MAALMTASEVAAYFGCSTRTVNRMAQTRQLPALKRGRHWRFSLESLKAYEAANTTVTNAPTVIRSAAPITATVYAPMPSGDGALPDHWWENRQALAASPAAGRARSAGNRKAASVRS